MTAGGAPSRTRASRTPGPLAERTLELPHRPSAVREARRRVAEDLRAREVDPVLVDEVEVVVSELLGNAVRHASPLPDGTVHVRWHVSGSTVDVEVVDGGGEGEVLPVPSRTWATSGRGLRIVRSLAHEWGVLDPVPGGGRAVWAALGGPSRRRR